jgi:carbon-monoxide dehydrogenase medium subunit
MPRNTVPWQEAGGEGRELTLKPIDLDYVAPTQLDAVLEALATVEDAKVLAGGQSLLPLLNFRLATPALLVDINGISGLDQIRAESGGITIGATVRQASALSSPLLARHVPLVPAALAYAGHPQIRSRGTVVGSLVHHDPAAELPAVAMALGARITLQRSDGQRAVDAAQYFVSSYTTDTSPEELATQVWFPTSPAGSGAGYEEIARRHGDFALVGVAAEITVTANEITRAVVAFSGVASRPMRSHGVEILLIGKPPTAEVFRTAARAALTEEGLHPMSDLHASATYRLEVLPVLVERALVKAKAGVDGNP